MNFNNENKSNINIDLTLLETPYSILIIQILLETGLHRDGKSKRYILPYMAYFLNGPSNFVLHDEILRNNVVVTHNIDQRIVKAYMRIPL